MKIILPKNQKREVDYNQIPPFTKSSNYSVNLPWSSLERWITEQMKETNLELNPDFQRGHVWTKSQQVKYVEFVMRGGKSGRDVYFNHPQWFTSKNICNEPYINKLVCVDGLQRITAIRNFMADKLPVFNKIYKSDFVNFHPRVGTDLIIHINDLASEVDILTWYYEFNSGGTPHSKLELKRIENKIKRLKQTSETK